MSVEIPVINLFAGAGGLAEGFCPVNGKKSFYQLAFAVEKDKDALQTFRLRNFCRQFSGEDLPDDYYLYTQREITHEELYRRHPVQAKKAESATWQAELGNPDSCPEGELDERISVAIGNASDWVLIGGPPCQAYSKAGRSRNKGNPDYAPERDPRFFLYMEYLRVIGKHKPSVFVMENVLGLLSAKADRELLFPRILKDLEKPHIALHRHGLKVSNCFYRLFSLTGEEQGPDCDPKSFVVRTEEHGLPQTRHRVILIGVRKDLTDYLPPSLKKTPPATLRDVIRWTPPLRSGVSRTEDSWDLWQRVIKEAVTSRWLKEVRARFGPELQDTIEEAAEKAIEMDLSRGGEFVPKISGEPDWKGKWFHDSRLKGTLNHSTRAHIPGDLHRYLFVASYTSVFGKSPRLNEFPAALLPAHINALSGKFPDRFRAQPYNNTAKTITSHISQDGHYFIHPDPSQCRSLTVREAARIQTFPDNYFFCGGRTSQYSQVGNAVPPVLGLMIADQVQSILTCA